MLFGIARDTATEWAGTEPDGDEAFAVWSDNWAAVTLFTALDTQWRIVHSGMGGAAFTGLDYAAAEAAMRVLGIPRRERAELFASLCLMERSAIPLLNKLNKAKG